MAIVKHIKSRNANYSAAINYLLFEHDEKTGKKIVDESGRSILRKEFYMDGLGIDHDSAGYATSGPSKRTDHQCNTLPMEAYDRPENLPKKYG